MRAETLAAPRPSDAPAHLSWIRYAEHRIEAGHSPLDGWDPDLSLGAPQFHQYQSLPHIAGGAVATVFGAAEVQRWTLYLLLCTWPISVFLMMLMLGFGFPPVVGVLLRARLGVSGIQMQRGMGIAARKHERQQHDQAAQD